MGRFELQTRPLGLEWLTEEVIEELCDLAVKLGSRLKPSTYRLFSADPEIAIAYDPEARQVVVAAGPDGFERALGCTLPFAHAGVEPAFLVWDVALTREKVNELMERARTGGLVMGSAPKWRVDDHFRTPGQVFPVDSDEDVEEIRLEFDRPQELAVLEGFAGAKVLCRSADVDLVKAQYGLDEATLAALREELRRNSN